MDDNKECWKAVTICDLTGCNIEETGNTTIHSPKNTNDNDKK